MVFGIQNGDTVRKVRSWLKAKGIQHDFHDYRVSGIDRNRLERWCSEFGWEVLLKRAGPTFCKLPDADKRVLDAREAASPMLKQPSLIKRPVLDLDGRLLVGFKPELYKSAVRAAR